MNTDIPVVILSGGKGTRLKEETEFRPKPMVTIGGKPILWHIMKIYQHFGFNNFIITLGYKGDMIVEYFKNNNEDGFNIQTVDTGLETLTGERILRVKDYIKEEKFMVTYGDGVGNISIHHVIQRQIEKNVIGVITGVHPVSKWGLIVKDKNDLILSFRQKPRLNEYVNGGYMIFDRAFFNYLQENEMIEEAFQRLIREKQLATYLHDGFWHAMDTYQDVEVLNQMWKENPEWKVW